MHDSALTCVNRPLRLIFDRPESSGGNVLLPQRVTGTEAVCGGFCYQIVCVAENAKLALKDFIGAPCELQIVTDRGAMRRICGIVTEAASGESDGGLASYRLTLCDALTVMENRINTRVFINRNELEIIDTLFREWQQENPVLGASFELRVDGSLITRKLPGRAFTMQHNESDAAFIRRLLQRQGLAWVFRPGLPESRTGSTVGPGPIGHTLVIFADSSHLPRNAAGSIRFHRDAATEERDTITGWSAQRKLVPGTTSLFSWNYKYPEDARHSATRSSARSNQGMHGNAIAAALVDYRVTPAHLGDNGKDLETLGNMRMAHHDYMAKCFHGEGCVRDLAAGEWFAFDGHPEIDTHSEPQRQFVVTSQRIVATSNLPADLGARIERLFARSGWSDRNGGAALAPDSKQPLRYQSGFICVRRDIRIVPPAPELPPVQLQSAIVVGPKDEVVWCDDLGRVKVRFPATRERDHAHASGSGASNSDRDSAWVRVASGWAGLLASGGAVGARLLPPIGTEVLVAFAGGDPDKPVIVAQVYNASATPPRFLDEQALPASRYQSGLRSHEIRGRRGNQLRLDDTPGQISAQLASGHAATELNLGYLTEPRSTGADRPRGEGAELRTEETIALHAARGILLSAWKLLGGAGTRGSQMARSDYLGLLRECGELCASLGSYAAEHNGLECDGAEQEALTARFAGWEDGSNTAAGAAPPREPVIAVTAPAGIGFASSKAIVTYAGSNVDTAAQRHLQLTAGQRFTVNAGKGVSLFAHHGGLHAIAHNGRLLMQSQHDDTNIDSAKNMQLTATEGTATISAKVILLVAQDGSFLKLGDGPPVLGSKAPLKFHGADFTFEGPQTMAAQFPEFGEGGADQRVELRYPDGDTSEDGQAPAGGIVKDMKMALALGDGSKLDTRSGADGKSELMTRDAMHAVEIALMRSGDQP